MIDFKVCYFFFLLFQFLLSLLLFCQRTVFFSRSVCVRCVCVGGGGGGRGCVGEKAEYISVPSNAN